MHRVIQDERSIFLEVILSVFVRKKSLYEQVSISEWLPRLDPPKSPEVTPLYLFCMDRWTAKITKVGLIHETICSRILDGVTLVENLAEQLGVQTRELRTRVAECIEADGGICGHSVWTVTYVICVWQSCHVNFKLTLKLDSEDVIFLSLLPLAMPLCPQIHTALSRYPFRTTHLFIWPFLTITNAVSFQTSDVFSWITLYNSYSSCISI
jgi:hypothetical protein